MNNSCSDIEAFIAALEKRRNQLIDLVTARRAEGSKSDAMQRQIKELHVQILQEMILLKRLQGKMLLAVTSKRNFVFTEQTQSIQYFNTAACISPEAAEANFNNSVPLINNKETLLRVYIDGSYNQPGLLLPAKVTGKITLQTSAAEISLYPINKLIEIRPMDQIDRMNAEHTLNFLLPKEYCSGQLSFKLELIDAEKQDSFISLKQNISFEEVPALKIHLINIHYTGYDSEKQINKTIEFAEIISMLNDLLPIFPVNQISIAGFETIEWNRSLLLDENREALLETIDVLRNIADDNALYACILPEEAGNNYINGADTNVSGICLVNAGNSATIKNLVRAIAAALGQSNEYADNEAINSNYSQQKIFAKESIQEAGIDLRLMEYKDPGLTTDYMSDGENAYWTSPDSYLQLLKIIQSGKFSDVLAAEKKQTEYYHLDFRRDYLYQQPGLVNAFHINQYEPYQLRHKQNGIRAYFYDNENVLIHNDYAGAAYDDNNNKEISVFQLSFPRLENMHRIQLVENNFSIGEYYIAPSPPQVYITGIDFREDGKNHFLHLTWEAATIGFTQPSLVYSIRFSADGLQWQPLFANINTNWCQVNLDQLPGGTACRIQILASAGLRTSIAETYYFSLPVKPRQIYWMLPKPQSVYVSGQPVYCSATAYSPNFRNAKQEEIIWTSLKHGYLGSGQQLTLTHLAPGKHWLQVNIPDGLGNLLTQQVEISIM